MHEPVKHHCRCILIINCQEDDEWLIHSALPERDASRLYVNTKKILNILNSCGNKHWLTLKELTYIHLVYDCIKITKILFNGSMQDFCAHICRQPLPWLKPQLPGFSGWGQLSQQAAHQIQSSPKLYPGEKSQMKKQISGERLKKKRKFCTYRLVLRSTFF